MNLTIDPFVGVETLRFGMSRNEVRSAIQSPYTSYLKGADTETDAFDDLGVHVYYDNQGRCEAIEFYGPCQPVLDSEQLLKNSYLELKSKIEVIDPALDEDESGFISHNTGIGVYAPSHIDSSCASVMSIIVFRKGYYDCV